MTTPRSYRWRFAVFPRVSLLLASVLFLVVVGLRAQLPDTLRKRQFAIPAGDAVISLERFSDQAGTAIVYLINDVQGVRTNAVKGSFTAIEALREMVANTELIAVQNQKTQTLTLTRTPASRKQDRSTDPPHSAQASTLETPNNMNKSRFPLRIAAWLAAISSALSAQEQSKTTDEPIILSPFVVDAKADQGYLAGSTLSGTRLRTDLMDVPSSVSVMNAEFLKDIGARNMQDALRYEVNVENENEYADLDTEGTANADTTTTRVRGMDGASISRNFFNTNISPDTYNSDRLTISRGPNSILFGIGSPAGVIDNTLKTASFLGNETTLEATFDQYNSRRFVFDHNQKLNDIFAVRVAAMTQDKQSFVKPEFDKEDRMFFTATLKPTKKTTIIANYEHVKDHRIRAHRITLLDGITDWVNEGRPLYDNSINKWRDRFGNIMSDSAAADMISRTGWNSAFGNQQTYIYSNGILVAPSPALPNGNQAMPTPMFTITPTDNGFGSNTYFPATLNPVGTTNYADIKGEAASATLQQNLAKNLDLEIVFNHEKYDNISREYVRPGVGNGIQVDVVMYLRDYAGNATSIPNPNVGRYFIQGDLIGFNRSDKQDSGRATLAYTLDLTDSSRFLGNNSFAALFQRTLDDNIYNKDRLENLIGWAPGKPLNDVASRSYVNLPGTPDNTGKPAYSGPFVSPAAAGYSWWPTSEGPLNELPSRFHSSTDATMGVWQGHFHLLPEKKDDLIFTAGIRNDSVDKYSYDYSSVQRDPVTAQYLWQGVPRPSAPTFSESGRTKSIGIVYKTPLKGLNLVANKSDNFTPQGDWDDLFSHPQKAVTGNAKDFGISVEAMDGKFYAKIVHFDASDKNLVQQDWYYWGPYWNVAYEMEDQINNWVQIYKSRGIDRSADLGKVNTLNFNNVRPTIDRVSKGEELELIFQPTPNWNIRLTGAYTKATDTNIDQDLLTYVASRLNVYQRYFPLTAYWYLSPTQMLDGSVDQAYQFQGVAPNTPVNQLWAAVANGYGGNFGGPDAWARYEELKRVGGMSTPRLSAYRVNLTTNYRFDHGPLKGFNMGGGARYRSPQQIGNHGISIDTGYLASPLVIADVSRPIYGDSITDVDLWLGYTKSFNIGGKKLDWSIEVFAYNAFANVGYRPAAVRPTISGPTVYSQYQIIEPRTVSIRNTIKF